MVRMKKTWTDKQKLRFAITHLAETKGLLEPEKYYNQIMEKLIEKVYEKGSKEMLRGEKEWGNGKKFEFALEELARDKGILRIGDYTRKIFKATIDQIYKQRNDFLNNIQERNNLFKKYKK